MIDLKSSPNLPTLFFRQARRLGDKPFLWAKAGDRYEPLSWRDTADQVVAFARGLKSMGLKPGERVLLVSENRPEWLIADIAIMATGGIAVPAYTTNTTDDHRYLLDHSEAKIAIVSTARLGDRLVPAAQDAAGCESVISLETLAQSSGPNLRIEDWATVMAKGRDSSEDIESEAERAGRDDTACFIYTSGTGGAPKGVMLSHGAMLCNCGGALHLLSEFSLGPEVFLSFLPLSHAYEHTVGQFFAIAIGAEIYYAENVERLLTNLAEARPTIMTAVPRLYESMHQRILRGVEKQGGMKEKLFHQTLALGLKRQCDPRGLTFSESLFDALLERLVRDKIRQRFGGRLKAMISGGAALNVDIGRFFTALGLPILQGYGQTEAGPVVSANPPGRVKLDTVGPPLRGVEVRIAEDGEILVRGELLMKGYWKDDEATRRTIVDNWLHTGDIGSLDEDGYLRITDRKKDIVVLSGGDNVSPARIESFLTLQPEVSQAMVFGDRKPHLVALLVPDPEFMASWAKENGKSANLEQHHEDPELVKALSPIVDRVNRNLSNLEKIRRVTIAPEAFSVDNGLLTPTLKIRRHKIRERYGDRLERLYG
jgi:long-chain acyl-CoA synthetase